MKGKELLSFFRMFNFGVERILKRERERVKIAFPSYLPSLMCCCIAFPTGNF